MSNEVRVATVDAAETNALDESDAPDVPETAAPRLVLIAGDDDLVCVDDTCLPAEATR